MMNLNQSIVMFLAVATINAAAEPIFRLENNRLIYGKDEKGNRLPDFSRVGYGGGDEAIPEVKTVVALNPISGVADDTSRIQAAIDRLAAMPADSRGIRGAVTLGKGVFRVAGTIHIKSGGVVLRGSGKTADGTVILATGQVPGNVIEVGDVLNPYPRLAFLRSTSPAIPVTDSYVPVGSVSFRVKDVTPFKPGDDIVLFYPPSESWIHTIGMDRIRTRPGDNPLRWETRLLYQRYERKIIRIEGDRVFIDYPVVNAIEAQYGGALINKYSDNVRISRCGVENLMVRSEYDRHNLTDENHARTAIFMDKVKDCWVKGVVAEYMVFGCVSIEGNCRNITVEDCGNINPISKIDGGRRYGFMINGQFILVQRCYANGNRHAFSTNGKVRGPNVFLDCLAENNYADIGPHQQWSTGTLYDNIVAPDGQIFVQDRGSCGGGHGWAGANEVLWNCRARDLICEKPPTAQNYCIGCTGIKHNGYTKIQSSGLWESHNKPVKPRSLYIQQLIERVGNVNALKVVTSDQINGDVTSGLIKSLRPKHIMMSNLIRNPELKLTGKQPADWFAAEWSKAGGTFSFTSVQGPEKNVPALEINYEGKGTNLVFNQFVRLSPDTGKLQLSFWVKQPLGQSISVTAVFQPDGKPEQRINSSSFHGNGEWKKISIPYSLDNRSGGKFGVVIRFSKSGLCVAAPTLEKVIL